MLVLRICNHKPTYIQWSHMLSTKPCARQITKMYNLVCDACGFFNLLKVDMFLNPTDIEPARADIHNSILYNHVGEVLAEFHGLPQMNPSFILLNLDYPMNYYSKNCAMHFVLIMCLRHCIYISQIY